MTPWETWCAGVLNGIAAPINAVNVDTLWAWSNAETAPYPLMRWENPMNTTEPWPGAIDSGAQPGAHDVKIYASLQDGCDATVFTLIKEPYYGAIVANLRASKPRQQWGATSTAGSELHAWGTGTNWLTTAPYFGPAPTSLLGDNVTATEHTWLLRLYVFFFGTAETAADPALAPYQAAGTKFRADIAAVLAKVNEPEPPETEPTPAPAIDPQVAANLATVAGFLRRFGLGS